MCSSWHLFAPPIYLFYLIFYCFSNEAYILTIWEPLCFFK